MIVDSSALMAILRRELEASRMVRALATAESAVLSAGTWIELAAVMSGRGDGLRAELDLLMTTYSIAIEPVTVEQAHVGHRAYREFGKGQHRARLNFGDCFAYALAKTRGEPLLFKGDDFVHTDVSSAI